MALLVELVLKPQAVVVRLGRTDGFDDGRNPAAHIPLAQLFAGHGAVAGIVIGKPRLPPASSH